VDVALVGGREARLGEPRFVELNSEISDDICHQDQVRRPYAPVKAQDKAFHRFTQTLRQ